MTRIVHHRCAVLVLTLACAGTPAAAGVIFDDFEANPLGGLPAGWNDAAIVLDPAATTPQPSAVVVTTMDAFGNPTLAVSTLNKPLGPLPTTTPTQGIYRFITPSGFYSTSADVRIDRFGDVTDFDCGCPPDLIASADAPMQVGFAQFQASPFIGMYASSRTQGWRMISYTDNVKKDYDLGVPVILGTWYGAQFDLDVATGTTRSRIVDIASGSVLADVVTVLPASWDPAVDGVFDIPAYNALELTGVKQSSLATIDNVRVSTTPVSEPGAMMLLASALLSFGFAARCRL